MSLRLRAFGPRDLTSDGIYRSNATVLLNADVGYQINMKWRFVVEFLNLLNRRDHDIDYAYESRITPTADAAFTDVPGATRTCMDPAYPIRSDGR
jgi:hypothetical protein